MNYSACYRLLGKLTLIILLTILNSGYGYVSDLPELGKESKLFGSAQDSNSRIQDKDPIIPLAPKTISPVYSGVIINRGKYSKYLDELDALIPVLENMKQAIENNDRDIQLFCAKANLINLYVTSLQTRYGNKTEKYYESFKQLTVLNKNLSETADYWRYTYKYNKLVRGSLKDKITDEKIMNQKLGAALNAINTTLEILKENTVDNY